MGHRWRQLYGSVRHIDFIGMHASFVVLVRYV